MSRFLTVMGWIGFIIMVANWWVGDARRGQCVTLRKNASILVEELRSRDAQLLTCYDSRIENCMAHCGCGNMNSARFQEGAYWMEAP